VVADRNAAFWLPELRLGFIPPAGIPLLINRVGAQRAFAICSEARLLQSREAHRMGIFDRLVPVGKARGIANKVAATMADRQAVAGLQLARSLVGFDMAEALATSFAEWQRLIATPVARANVERFLSERGKAAQSGGRPAVAEPSASEKA
jgi:enoyl-CoA hydratase/carnithine racemase